MLYSDPIFGQIFMEVPYHFLNGEIGGNKRVRVNRALIKGILVISPFVFQLDQMFVDANFGGFLQHAYNLIPHCGTNLCRDKDASSYFIIRVIFSSFTGTKIVLLLLVSRCLVSFD